MESLGVLSTLYLIGTQVPDAGGGRPSREVAVLGILTLRAWYHTLVQWKPMHDIWIDGWMDRWTEGLMECLLVRLINASEMYHGDWTPLDSTRMSYCVR